MAHDFPAAFNDLLNLKSDDKTIAPLDENGVALTAIQARNEIVENKNVGQLKEKQTSLEYRLNNLEKLIGKMAE